MSEASTLPGLLVSAGEAFILSLGTRSPCAVGVAYRPRFGFAASDAVFGFVVPFVDRKAIMPTPKTTITPITTSMSERFPRPPPIFRSSTNGRRLISPGLSVPSPSESVMGTTFSCACSSSTAISALLILAASLLEL